MKPRQFHINKFPGKKIRILLRNQNEFIDKSIGKFGSIEKLANYLKVSPEVVKSWKTLFIPLSAINKINKKLKIKWSKLERDIVAYKGMNTSSPIKNPILPIKESPELFALIIHLIGDGSVNKNGIPIYTNSNKDLILKVKKLVNRCFGEVKGKIYICKWGTYQYRFPKILSDLLIYFYNINFDSKKSSIPTYLANLPLRFSKEAIKAFVDDEGGVDLNNRIAFYSSNEHLLYKIINLLVKKFKFKEISKIKAKKDEFYFYIKSKEVKKFHDDIGFEHPKKQKQLKNLIKTMRYKPGQHGKRDETKNKILELLKNKSLSTNEIIDMIGIRKSNINMSLKQLEKEEIVQQDYKKGQSIYWTKMEG